MNSFPILFSLSYLSLLKGVFFFLLLSSTFFFFFSRLRSYIWKGQCGGVGTHTYT